MGTSPKSATRGQEYIEAFVRVTDKKFPAGIFVSMNFEGPSSAPQALKEKLRLDKTIYRILVQAA